MDETIQLMMAVWQRDDQVPCGEVSMKARLVLLTFVTMLLCGIGVADAHHAFAGTYLLDQQVTIEGTLVDLSIRNPHSFVSLDVKDADGKTTCWGVEWGGVSLLRQTGVGRTSLKSGDVITVVGAPAHDGSLHRLMLQQIARPADGWDWGNRPGEVLPHSTPETAYPNPGLPRLSQPGRWVNFQ
jgi:hypothetical protein